MPTLPTRSMWLPDPWQSGSSRQRPGCSQDRDLWLKIVRWAGDSGDSGNSGDTWQCRCSLLTWTTSPSAPATAPPPATAVCRWPGGTLSSCVVMRPFSSVESYYPPVLVLSCIIQVIGMHRIVANALIVFTLPWLSSFRWYTAEMIFAPTLSDVWQLCAGAGLAYWHMVIW